MANTQISINSNGKKTLLTAGKLCDKNIDIKVNVPPQALPFTNLYDPANVTVQTFWTYSSNTLTSQSDAQVNTIKVYRSRQKGETFEIRMRGMGFARDRNQIIFFNQNGDAISGGQTPNYLTLSYDEYGDAILKYNGADRAWDHFGFSFQYTGALQRVTTPFEGPIITVNEPIGSGSV